MKNLLEELRELNNEESIEVPVDFRDKVVDKIMNEEHTSKLKYIIPACSVAAVMLIAIVVANNPNNRKTTVDSVENMMIASGIQDEYYPEEIDALPTAVNDDLGIIETEDNTRFESAKAVNASNKIAELDTEYYDEILEMLKINNIEAEKTSDGIRAKGKKEDIEVALYYFEDNIEIKQDGEYVVIKEK